MGNFRCYLLKETGKAYLFLRRFTFSSAQPQCPLTGGGHDAMVLLPEVQDIPEDGIIYIDDESPEIREKYASLWPSACRCGYKFTDEDQKQLFKKRQYVDDKGKETDLEHAIPGAIWESRWYAENFKEYTGPDGRSLFVKLPDGYEWCIDSRASNCDMPCLHCGVPYKDHKGFETGDNHRYEDLRPHKCWVRHGEPPNLHVDKNGVTCGAGAGSIASPGYHGFLHNGELTNA